MVNALGAWGIRWIGHLGEEDLDPHLLMWDMRRTIPVSQWPRGRTVIAFEFTDIERRAARWWLCVTGDDVDVCDYDPGFEVTATVTSDLRTLIELWRADRSWAQALSAGLIQIDGPRTVTSQVPSWLGQMTFAAVSRPA